MENDPEKAAEYLLALHDELESLGPWPRSAVPAAILIVVGGGWLVSGAAGLVQGQFIAALPWIALSTAFLLPGTLLGRRTFDWFKTVRSLRRGIELIERRQLERAESRNEEPTDESTSPLLDP